MNNTLALMQRQMHQGQPHYRPRTLPVADAQQASPPISGQQQQAPGLQRAEPGPLIMNAMPASETRLQRASRLLAESKAVLEQHDLEIQALQPAAFRKAMAHNQRLRMKVAQCSRDVIWAEDRIRFGWD